MRFHLNLVRPVCTGLLLIAGITLATPTIASAATPNAPTGVGVAFSTAGAKVSWTAPTPVSGVTITGYTATATPAVATVILDSLRLCVNRMRFFLCRADTNNLWSGALCARLPPGALPADDKRPAGAEARRCDAGSGRRVARGNHHTRRVAVCKRLCRLSRLPCADIGRIRPVTRITGKINTEVANQCA